MKKYEIKTIEVISAFKATLYLAIVPMALISVIGVFLTIGGILAEQPPITIIGVTYIFMPVFMIIIYGLFSMLGALIYSKLAERFGGLEVTLAEKETSQPVIYQSVDTERTE